MAHKRTKHVKINIQLVHEGLLSGEEERLYMSTSENVSDIFTKDLPNTSFYKMLTKLGISNIHFQIERGC